MKFRIIIFCIISCSLFITCSSSSNSDDIIMNEDDNSNNEEEEEEIPFDFTITSFSPEQGKVGDTISILGTNFSSIIEDNEVTFDGVTANIINASESQIDVIVPLQLPEGDFPVSLTIQELTKPVGVFNITIDDYKYLAVSSNTRNVYSIGNISGVLNQIGSIEQVDYNSFISRTITNSPSKIYGMANYHTQDHNVLLVYDKLTGLTNEIVLEIPNSIEGSYKAIVTLNWDEQNSELVGLLDPNQIFDGSSGFHVIRINPNTYEVIDTGILTPEAGSTPTSCALINNSLYYNTLPSNSDIQRDLNKIDLLTGEPTLYYFNDYNSTNWRISKTNDVNVLFGIRTTVGSNAIVPIKIDLIQNSVTDLAPYNGYTVQSMDGNAFYDSHINKTVIVSGNYDTGLSLYKFNEISEELIPIEGPAGYNPTMHIIGYSE